MARKAEVSEGRWRNPALTDAARRKLSRPRKHTGALARAIDKARTGGMAGLPPAAPHAHLRWRRELRHARADAIRRYQRERYHRLQGALARAERESQRERWRAQNRRRQRRKQEK